MRTHARTQTRARAHTNTHARTHAHTHLLAQRVDADVILGREGHHRLNDEAVELALDALQLRAERKQRHVDVKARGCA
eukprot:1766788-Pleurochrysis_carterae.AAC.1